MEKLTCLPLRIKGSKVMIYNTTLFLSSLNRTYKYPLCLLGKGLGPTNFSVNFLSLDLPT